MSTPFPKSIYSVREPVGRRRTLLKEGLDFKEYIAREKWHVIHAAYLADEQPRKTGLIERVAGRIGLENSSDLQRTILPQIIRECPGLAVEIRECFPERQKP